jgi:hypothetical protein
MLTRPAEYAAFLSVKLKGGLVPRVNVLAQRAFPAGELLGAHYFFDELARFGFGLGFAVLLGAASDSGALAAPKARNKKAGVRRERVFIMKEAPVGDREDFRARP